MQRKFQVMNVLKDFRDKHHVKKTIRKRNDRATPNNIR